jgi:hypothetical protein
LTVEEIARRFHGDMSAGSKFSYFTAMPVAEEDLKQYPADPSQPCRQPFAKALPAVEIILVPFLEKNNGKGADPLLLKNPDRVGRRRCRRNVGIHIKMKTFRLSLVFTAPLPRWLPAAWPRHRASNFSASCAKSWPPKCTARWMSAVGI